MSGIRARRVVALLAVATLLAGCARPADPSASQPPVFPWEPVPSRSGHATPSATTVACPSEGVRVEAGEGNAAMGLRVLGITLVPSRVIAPRGGLDLGSTGRIGVSAWRLLPDRDTRTPPADRPAPGASTA